jgi:glutaredoxin
MMVSTRQIRLVGLAILGTFLVFVLYGASSSDSNSEVTKDGSYQLNNQQAASSVLTSNKLIDSEVDDKKDAAINNKIMQLGQPASSTSSSASSEVPSSDFDAAAVFLQIRSLSPMTIFSKSFCPYSKRIKTLLHDNYEITPEPTIVELDKHANGKELQKYIEEITGRATVPNVLVGALSDSRGGADDFIKLHGKDELLALLNAWGNKKLAVKKIKAPSNV